MTYLLAYPVAVAAAFPTTLAVMALWVAHSRLVDGDRADSVFLAFVFLFMPLILFVAAASNVLAVALGQVASLLDPAAGLGTTVAAAGVIVALACAWTQRGSIGPGRRPAPVSSVPVVLFSLADMLILAGGLCLLPNSSSI